MTPHLSIVSSLYKSERFLDQFLEELQHVLKVINCKSFEIIFVNDGSPDGSVEKLLSWKQKIPQIRIIDLSRNFGHHYAFSAGMHHAKGELIFNIDCDLEVRPSVLERFHAELTGDSELDVVYGYQKSRKGGLSERLFGGLFWKIFNWVADTQVPADLITERLMKKQYVQSLLSLGEKNLFLAGMMHWVGFKQKGVAIGKEQRRGKSTYSFRKRVRLMIEAVSSFSAYPLKMLFKLGIVITIFSFLYAFYLLFNKIMHPEEVLVGYTSIIVAILFSTGIIVLSLGLLGIYLEKMFNQTKNRPLYIIKRIIE